jgi:sec-independent protein translocase protein TatA
MPELIVVLVIVMVVFGAGKLPEIGGAFGRSIRNFKDASQGKDAIQLNPDQEEKTKNNI